MHLQIEKLVYGGDGLARVESTDGRKQTVFVPLVLPGETVEATIVEQRPGFARAKLDRVISSAPQRTAPPCPYFGECGGCHYQHAAYEAQLEFKKQILRETISRIAKIELPEITAHASPPLKYRNRTRMKVEAVNGRFALGYYSLGSHKLLAVKECPISSPLTNQAVQTVWSLSATHALPRGLSEIEFFANAEDSELLIEFLVESDAEESALRKFAEELRRLLPSIKGVALLPRPRIKEESVAAPELDGSETGSARTLVGESSLQYRVGEFALRVSAGSFFQTNRFLTQTLIDLVTKGSSGKRALDLYAGAGLFTLPLAKQFERVTAVEIGSSSFRDLSANSPRGVKCIEATTELFLHRFNGPRPDFVVVDPPRAGLGKRVTSSLAKLAPKSIGYISCDPSTLGRDLPALIAAGYRIAKADLVDLFPQTFHMETVLRLER